MKTVTLPDEKEIEKFQRFPLVYSIYLLVCAVVILFYLYINLSNKMMDIQTNVIQQNTEALHNFQIKNSIK